jgi:DNA modification methylase
MIDYADFLKEKKRVASTVGIDVSLDDINPILFDFQRVLVQWALRKGRAALFVDTGLGKTFCQVEWARLVGGTSLIVAPLSVARQTVNEAAKIGVDVHYTRSGDDVIKDGINITNYEMLDHFDPTMFRSIVLDESSILKSLDGKTKTKLIDLFRDVPYKLCCTATPAPNDVTELTNHAEFLNVMTRTEMLSMFFVHDNSNGSGSGWRLKRHAETAFYRWLASWSMSVKKPSDIGFSDEGYILPALHVIPAFVETDYSPPDQLFFTGLHGIQDRAKARKGTINERINHIVSMVSESSQQWILWCGMNEESATLAKLIPDSVEVTGSDSPDKKIDAIERFQRGDIRVLITKPKIAGFGINLQNCFNMAFIGLSDSFEAYYQCVRRCYRFGQKMPVFAYIVLADIEREIYANVMEKEQEAKEMSDKLIDCVKESEMEELALAERKEEYRTDTIRENQYTIMLGDSCERLAEVADNSIDMALFSPPFESLYTYSPTERDLGNSKTSDEFYTHFNYIIDHLLRAIKPGRNCCVHVQQLAASLINDGYIGLKDFRGDVIRAFIARGFIYHGEICIQKNPQSQAVRTKAKGLMFVQLHKDSSWLRPGLADYIVVFRKPGENAVPIHPNISHDDWIKWAHPVWYDIKESDTLNVAEGRDKDDEKHVCPLQLQTIERCVRLWSNPGETILSPFMGIGSEGYESVRHDRKFVGIELKPSYFQAAQKNLARAVATKQQATLFDL